MSAEITQKCTKSQTELVKQANNYVMDHIDKHITIRELADLLHVSQTQLKNSYRNYFGESIYRYVRSRKMRMAADKLAETELSVMEIAVMFGYENCSKFAAAFRGELGTSPSDYRRQHRGRD